MSAAPHAPAYRLDGREVDADTFYAAACDPRRSVVVEACAGAGKTWMLVSRIVRALLEGAEPQQVLAITFTRKAAGEMRERLDQWLAAWAAPSLTDAQRAAELRLRGLDAAAAARLAPALGALHGRLLEAGRAVEVRTFHGWFAQLVSHAPLALLQSLGLPPAPDLVEDTGELRPELMRRFHAAVNADPALRADYAALVREHRRGSVLAWLEAAWQRSTEIACAIEAGTLEASVPPAAALAAECAAVEAPLALLRRAPRLARYEALASALGAAKGKKAQDAGAGLRAALEAADDAAAFAGAWQALFTKDEPRKQLGEVPGLDDAFEDLRALQRLQRQHQAWRDQQRMGRLVRVLLAEFAALKRRRGLVDMPDLERAALALLSEHELAGWVQERLDQQVRHLLIDEFQDTSPLQWQALHGWLAAYSGAGVAPSVFIVGDPKQSIYRFRRAEPRVFEAARRFVAEGLRGQVLECDHTRRNAPAVIAALNAVFEDAQRSDGWGPYRAHTTGSAEAGAVLALPGVPRSAADKAPPREGWRDSLTEPRHEADLRRRQTEAAQVADAVAEALGTGGFRPGQLMVLARRRVVLSDVAGALAARHVPHVMPEALVLADSPEALDLAALLDVLASPAHDLSLARALKSPLFGATDADLLWLARRAHETQTAWRHALAAAEEAPGAALPRARALLARWQAVADRLPPHDLLDRVVHEADLVPRLVAAVPAARRHGALQAVQATLAAALELDGGRYTSLYGFVRALKSGRLKGRAAAPAEAVQLLTVHGAKGLEAEVVFVADADPEPRRAESSTLLVDWPVGAAAPACVAFVRSEARLPPSLAERFAVETAARDREELNGLYVAMTRARQRLVFSHNEPRTRAAGWRSWWQRAAPHTAPWVPAAPPAGGAEPPPRVAVQAAPRPRAVVARTPAAQDAAAARLGQAVHRALEWLGQPGQPTADTGIDTEEACNAAAAAFGADAAVVGATVRRVLANPHCRRFFDPARLRWAGNEVPLADAEGVLRLDRLVQLQEDTGPVWWVLDYKLASEPAALAAHAPQMARYLAAVRAAQPGEPVRGGFLTGRGSFVEFDAN